MCHSLVLTDRPPPIILQGPVNQTLAVDGTALLKCKATGDPLPVISWLKEGFTFLGRDPRTSIQDQGTLQIKTLRVSSDYKTSAASGIWLVLSFCCVTQAPSSAVFLSVIFSHNLIVPFTLKFSPSPRPTSVFDIMWGRGGGRRRAKLASDVSIRISLKVELIFKNLTYDAIKHKLGWIDM